MKCPACGVDHPDTYAGMAVVECRGNERCASYVPPEPKTDPGTSIMPHGSWSAPVLLDDGWHRSVWTGPRGRAVRLISPDKAVVQHEYVREIEESAASEGPPRSGQ